MPGPLSTILFAAAVASALTGTDVGAAPLASVYHSHAGTVAGCSGSLCTATFATVPAGAYLRVDHVSCALPAAPERAVLRMQVRWGAGGVAQGVYQRPDLEQPPIQAKQPDQTGPESAVALTYVSGNLDVIIPEGEAPQVTWYAADMAQPQPACDLSGDLVPSL